MNKRRFTDDSIRKDIESLDKEQLTEIISELYLHGSVRTIQLADRLITKMVQAKAESGLDDSQKADIRKAIEADLEKWLNANGEELYLIVNYNPNWKEWEATNELFLIVKDPVRVGRKVQKLLLDAETASRNHWWDLAIRVIQAVYADPIAVKGDACYEGGGLELLEEYIWAEDLSGKTIRNMLKQVVGDGQLATDQKIQTILELMRTGNTHPDVLQDLAESNASLVSSPEFLNPWLAHIMEDEFFSEYQKQEAFEQAVNLCSQRENADKLLWKYGPQVPRIYLAYFESQNEHWSPKRKISYLERASKRPELNVGQSAELLDQLVSAYGEAGQPDQMVEAGIQAFNHEPSLRRYRDLVLLCPEKQYLPVFKNGWEKRIRSEASLIEIFEGNPENAVQRLQNADGDDLLLVITVLLGLLCEGEINNKSLQNLVSHFLIEGERLTHLSALDSDSKVSASDYVLLFKRAAQRIGWDQKQVDQLLKLIYTAIKSYTDTILSWQNRHEYFRCAQLIGALACTAELRGYHNAAQDLAGVFREQTGRYRKFRAEFKKWVCAGG